MIDELRSRDILQIDATIITGVLILLTLSFQGENVSQQNSGENMSQAQFNEKVARLNYAEDLKTVWTMTIIVPFAFSALFVIESILNTKTKRNYFQWAIGAMRMGFGYIIIAIVGIGLLQIIR